LITPPLKRGFLFGKVFIDMKDLIRRILREELSEGGKVIPDEEIRRRISKFETLKDLTKYDPATYMIAKRRGQDFFNDVTKDLIRGKKKRTEKSTRWSAMSEKDLLKIINKFSDTQALSKYEPRLYHFLIKGGKEYYDKMTKGLKRIKSRLTPDDILNIASQYNTYTDFIRGNPKAFAALRYHKLVGNKELLDKIENMFPDKETRRVEYTDDELIQIASKYPTLKSFRESEPSPYQVLNRKRDNGNLKLYNDATKHMQRERKPKMLKDNEIDLVKSVISQYDNLKDFVENEPNLFISMKRRGPMSFYDLTKDLEQNYDVKW
jgi:hypothetical protein